MFRNAFLLSVLLFLTLLSCSSDDEYTEVPDPDPVSPVVLDLNAVPYQNLSDYKFFEGPMKEQNPSYGVLPYEPISSLFTDYALKKRFVWMPKDSKASYNSDGTVFNFPTGSVLIKNFYYDNVQPGGGRRIIETRLLIKKASGWVFAEYVWNAEQTEATLNMNGAFTSVSWLDSNGELQTVDSYRIPSASECLICHKILEDPKPIGPKPQNLNSNYNYADGTSNQLSKWVNFGYLENNLPSNIATVVDYKDTSKPLPLRVRSYLDIQCAHCHQQDSHCDYRPIRLAFSETTSAANLGICVPPDEVVDPSLTNIVTPGNVMRSMMHYRLNTNEEQYRMPLIGRSVIHTEGVQLIENWINSLNGCN
jgi:uncharacterized repeat protein (TIGR03806 family)